MVCPYRTTFIGSFSWRLKAVYRWAFFYNRSKCLLLTRRFQTQNIDQVWSPYSANMATCFFISKMIAAARLVTGTRKFDHGLSRLLDDDLHWIDVPGRIQYKIGITVHRCLQSKEPKYLTDCCTLVSEIASRRHLHSASRPHLSVTRYRLSTFGRRAFSGAGPTVWNSLPDSLRDPALSSSSFSQLLKTDLFNRYSAHSAQ